MSSRPFDSSIGPIQDGQRAFTLHIRGYCEVYPPGFHVFEDTDQDGQTVQRQVELLPISPQEISNFQTAAAGDIDAVWNGSLWMSTGPLNPLYTGPRAPPLECRIELTWVTSPQDGHLHIKLIKSSGNLPRSNCFIGGQGWFPDLGALLTLSGNAVDMKMHLNQAGRSTHRSFSLSPHTTETVPTSQRTFAHEFGHYIGLSHVCAGRGFEPGSNEEYGADQNDRAALQNIMGVGEQLTWRSGRPWRERLSEHGYFPDAPWFVVTERPPRTETVMTMRTRDFQG